MKIDTSPMDLLTRLDTKHAPLIVDTRGRYPEPSAHIIKD